MPPCALRRPPPLSSSTMTCLRCVVDPLRLDPRAIAIVFTCVIAFVVVVYRSKRSGKSPHDLPRPPGPRPLPIVGNLFDVPIGCAWIKLSEWAKKYGASIIPLHKRSAELILCAGEIVHIKVLGQDIVFLNSFRVAKELLDKRSSIYSDRPRMALINEL